MNKKRKIRNFFNLITQMLVGACFGFFLAFIMLEGMTADHFLLAVFGLIMIILSYFVQLVMHEAGHLIFGLLTGYEFNSFRVGSWMWVKTDAKIEFKRMTMKGTGGQCLMVPPKEGKAYFLYNAGGVIVNMITGFITLLIGLALPTGYLRSAFLAFGLAGIFTGVTNGVPMIIGPIANDGYNILSIMKESKALDAFYVQLNVAVLLAEGKVLKDMPEEWFVFDEKLIKNPLIGALANFKSNQCLQKGDIEEAKRINQMIIDDDRTLGIFEISAKCDNLMIEIMNEQNPEVMRRYAKDKDVKQNMKTIQGSLLAYAYATLIEKDEKKISKAKKNLELFISNYPYAGEVEIAKQMIEQVNQKVKLLENAQKKEYNDFREQKEGL